VAQTATASPAEPIGANIRRELLDNIVSVEARADGVSGLRGCEDAA
jgi:hypothetical protein